MIYQGLEIGEIVGSSGEWVWLVIGGMNIIGMRKYPEGCPTKEIGHKEILGRIIAYIYEFACLRPSPDYATEVFGTMFIIARLLRYHYILRAYIAFKTKRLDFPTLGDRSSIRHDTHNYTPVR